MDRSEKRTFEKLWRRWEDSIKMNLEITGWYNVDKVWLTQDGGKWLLL